MSRKLAVAFGIAIFAAPVVYFLGCRPSPHGPGVIHVRPINDFSFGQIAEVVAYEDGESWLIVRGNHETKALFRLSQRYALISNRAHAPKAILAVLQDHQIVAPLVYCRVLSSEEGEIIGADRIWDGESGELLHAR
jgi:hypothetical protein